MNGKFYFNPRYTTGSPGHLETESAAETSVLEQEAYGACLRGELGANKKQRAQRLGLEGIVTETNQSQENESVTVRDVVTGSVRQRMSLTAAEALAGDRVVGFMSLPEIAFYPFALRKDAQTAGRVRTVVLDTDSGKFIFRREERLIVERQILSQEQAPGG